MAEIVRHQPSSAGSGSWALAPSLVTHLPDQRVLSDRVKTAIKTALATVLAYGVALSMDWENAYWAAFAVAFCTLSTVGESLNKGLLRLFGTLLGSLAAVTLQTVITRAEETALGIASYSLVWLLIWPTRSSEALEDTVRRLAAAHRQLAAHYLTPTIGETHDAGPQALGRQTTQVLARLCGLVDGAEVDSYEVWEARHTWRSLIHQF
jgi:uncharacterized membrane protein YccC